MQLVVPQAQTDPNAAAQVTETIYQFRFMTFFQSDVRCIHRCIELDSSYSNKALTFARL